jgi:predicted DNA-binding ribbon-helix-helix protein
MRMGGGRTGEVLEESYWTETGRMTAERSELRHVRLIPQKVGQGGGRVMDEERRRKEANMLHQGRGVTSSQ